MKSKKGKFWIFAFNGFYPKGGMNDFQFSFNNIEEFEEEVLNLKIFDVYQILDLVSHYHFQGDLGTVTTWICKNVGGERYE